MEQYLPVVVLAALAVVFVLLSIAASRLLAPRRYTTVKLAPYECGITDQAAIPERFDVRFYLVAMLFIMFDIEIVFFYPWAVTNTALGLFGFLAMLVFVVIFFLSFVYEIAMGGLNWGPARRPAPASALSANAIGTAGESAQSNSQGAVGESAPATFGRRPISRDDSPAAPNGIKVVGLTGREENNGRQRKCKNN